MQLDLHVAWAQARGVGMQLIPAWSFYNVHGRCWPGKIPALVARRCDIVPLVRVALSVALALPLVAMLEGIFRRKAEA